MPTDIHAHGLRRSLLSACQLHFEGLDARAEMLRAPGCGGRGHPGAFEAEVETSAAVLDGNFDALAVTPRAARVD